MVLVFVFFGPILKGGFVWDDEYNLVNNPHFRGLGWSQIIWMFSTFHDGNYHPLCWLSLGLDFKLWGLNPAGYHLTDLILHGLNSVLLYLFIVAVLQKCAPGSAREPSAIRVGAALGALFFALHPLRVESVAWISTRGDTLCGFFYLLTLLAYLRIDAGAPSRARNPWFWLALLFFTASLMSRAWGITLPVILLLLDVYPLKRLRVRDLRKKTGRRLLLEKVPFALLAIVFALLALLAKKGSMIAVSEHGIIARILQAFYGLGFYVWKTVLPLELSPLYAVYDFNAADLKYSACAVLVAGFTGGLVLFRKRWPWALVTWASYVITISPQLGIVQSGPQIVADRYTYIAGMPFAVLAAGGIMQLWHRGTDRTVLTTIRTAGLTGIVAWVLLLGSLSYRQIDVWQNNLTFWNRVLRINPDNPLAINERARLKFESIGDLAGAESDYSRLLRLEPENAQALVNRGLVRLALKNHPGAVADFKAAGRFEKNQPEVHNGLGLVYYQLGQIDAAEQQYNIAVRLNPEFADAYNNRGLLYKTRGSLNTALKDFDTAIRLDPNLAGAYANRGSVRQAQRKLELAVRDYTTALAVAPPNWPGRKKVAARLRQISGRPDTTVND